MTHFAAREFETIRIRCMHAGCEALTELPAHRVAAVMKKTGSCCPVCGKPFTRPDVEGGADVVSNVANAVVALSSLGGQVQIEFPIRESSGL